MKASPTKRNIVLMLISDVTSTYGSTVFNLAMMWFIYSETGSAFGASVIAALSTIAMVVASPLAGVLVDRFDPVKLLRLSLLSASVLLGILFVSSLYVDGLTLVFIIYAVVFLLYLAYSITNPAENKVVPNIVSKDKVASLYGMKSSTSQLSSLAGNASSGFLITLFSLAGSILINSVAFLFSALALTFIRVLKPFDKEAPEEERPSMRTQMRQGIEAIKDHPVLKKIALLCVVINIASFGPLLVVLTSSQYGGDAKDFGFLNSAGLVGGVIAGIIIGYIQKKVRPALLMAAGFIFSGALLAAMALIHTMSIAFILYGSAMFFVTTANIMLQTIMAVIVPESLRGRVNGILTSASVLLIPVSSLLMGWLTDLVGVSWVFLFCGLWIAAIGCVTMLMKDTRNIDIEESLESSTA